MVWRSLIRSLLLPVWRVAGGARPVVVEDGMVPRATTDVETAFLELSDNMAEAEIQAARGKVKVSAKDAVSDAFLGRICGPDKHVVGTRNS